MSASSTVTEGDEENGVGIVVSRIAIYCDSEEEPAKIISFPRPMERSEPVDDAPIRVRERRTFFGSTGKQRSVMSSSIGCWANDMNTGDYWIPPENECNKNEPLVVDFRCACFKLTGAFLRRNFVGLALTSL